MVNPITLAHLGSSAVLVMAGLVVVGMSLRAYNETSRRAMIHLSIGFTLVVAATAATVVGTYVTSITSAKGVLVMNNGLMAVGFIFVVYSLISYSDG